MALAQDLDALKDEIQGLIDADPPAERKARLRGQLIEVLDEIDRVTARNVDERTVQYREATEALEAAHEEIRAARADLARVAEAIERIATVISKVQEAAQHVL
jgi:chromosome segregation ATPase